MDSQAVTLGVQAIQAVGIVLAPLLVVLSVVGVAVGLLQAVTQIQDQTISFVVKIVAAGVTIYVLGPWAINFLATFVKNAVLGSPL